MKNESVKAWNPRPGWFARNLKADFGRAFDFRTPESWAKMMVHWDWTEGHIEGYLNGKLLVHWRASGIGNVRRVMALMEKKYEEEAWSYE